MFKRLRRCLVGWAIQTHIVFSGFELSKKGGGILYVYYINLRTDQWERYHLPVNTNSWA